MYMENKYILHYYVHLSIIQSHKHKTFVISGYIQYIHLQQKCQQTLNDQFTLFIEKYYL